MRGHPVSPSPVSSPFAVVSVHGHSMFRLVDRPLSFRQRANEWIYKMLFLWSREPVPGPRAGPWFAWFATAVVLWRCRRRITKAILAVSPLRLLKRRCLAPINQNVVYVPKSSSRVHQATTKTTVPSSQRDHTIIEKDKKLSLILSPKHTTGIKTRVKRLCTGDGPHVSGLASVVQTTQQVNYRVTRSGRVYGKYPNKIVAQSV